ncbi:hypothetical protein [Sphingomonas quercus]|nr:hypothetical protein [Sphingomonas quercus]
MFFRSLAAGLVALAATTMTVLFSAAPVEMAYSYRSTSTLVA